MRRLSAVVLLAAHFVWWTPAGAAVAGESMPAQAELGNPASSFPAVLDQVPIEAEPAAALLLRLMELGDAETTLQSRMKELRFEEDAVKTKLATINGELAVIADQQQQVEQQLREAERQRDAYLASLRQELDARIDQELLLSREEIAEQTERDYASHVEAFDARSRASIGHALDQEFQLKERELDQLSQEIDVQTRELVSRLGRLQAGTEMADSLQRAAQETIAQRRAELEAHRAQLAAERDALVSQQRTEFIGQVKSQLAAELERRMLLKEASLRQAMAEVLRDAIQEETGRLGRIQQGTETLAQRYGELAQQQAAVLARADSLAAELDAQVRRGNELEAERAAAVARLEDILQKPDAPSRATALAWFGEAIQFLPPELATELGLLRQRLVVLAEQAHQLKEQQRMLRERQLALQLSHEMELRYRQLEEQQRQDQEARSRKAEKVLEKAAEALGRGRYDEALRWVGEAQSLNPPQLSRVAMIREQIIAEKERAIRQAKDAQIEESFARAMEVFEQGRYEEAITLFEQVIAQEAQMVGEGSVQLAGQPTP